MTDLPLSAERVLDGLHILGLRSEPYPMQLGTAWQSECPVCCHDLPGLNLLVTDNGNGTSSVRCHATICGRPEKTAACENGLCAEPCPEGRCDTTRIAVRIAAAYQPRNLATIRRQRELTHQLADHARRAA